jgi:DNA-binding PadR family transcriptional regulator
MHKRSFLDAIPVREGEMPEKVIYTINEKGLDYFSKLMKNYSENIGRNYFDFSSFVINLDKVDKVNGLKMIDSLQKQFGEVKAHLEETLQMRSGLKFNALSIIKLYKELFDLFLKWSYELRKDYTES